MSIGKKILKKKNQKIKNQKKISKISKKNFQDFLTFRQLILDMGVFILGLSEVPIAILYKSLWGSLVFRLLEKTLFWGGFGGVDDL